MGVVARSTSGAGLAVVASTSVLLAAAGAWWLRSVSSLEPRMGNVCNDMVSETSAPYLLFVLAFVPVGIVCFALGSSVRSGEPGRGGVQALQALTALAVGAAVIAPPSSFFFFFWLMIGSVLILPLLLIAVVGGTRLPPNERRAHFVVLALDIALPGIVFALSLHAILVC